MRSARSEQVAEPCQLVAVYDFDRSWNFGSLSAAPDADFEKRATAEKPVVGCLTCSKRQGGWQERAWRGEPGNFDL
jgi:hypothetical protein